MTSSELRQSFLDFFAGHGHTIVPSSPLLPDSPGLLFTNAGMNQFVPIFLGDRAADVSRWAGAKPGRDTRAADTQKCIRAGGKHNDLEDVGFDTYHHTFFEMLGNWSFGDYFKKESLEWGWDLLTRVWGIPAKRLFATVYSPDKAKGDPSDFDGEAHDIWAGIFARAGLDPKVHIVLGGKKDNFWMMGDTGPCGPCSEIHFNLMPDDGESAGRGLVNAGSPRCIEIWNHVFIQFNANADGTFSPLAAKHVDTGMGFERVAGIHAVTGGFRDFTKDPSNYAADLFGPLFEKIAELSGRTYRGTVPAGRGNLGEQENVDIAFRVLADHARCVSCAVADGILPGNEGGNYVIRRILRRGILYGRKLELETGFFEELVGPVVDSLGGTFPELRQQQGVIRRVIHAEEENFGRTLERGMSLFTYHLPDRQLEEALLRQRAENAAELKVMNGRFMTNDEVHALAATKPPTVAEALGRIDFQFRGAAPDFDRRLEGFVRTIAEFGSRPRSVPGALAFELYDTYGFPLDMTQLLAAEHGLGVDVDGFDRLMGEQRERGRAAQKKDVVVAATGDGAPERKPTRFLGYTVTSARATLLEAAGSADGAFLVFDQTPFYAEMGGQAGDAGDALIGGRLIRIADCVKDKAGRHLHKVAEKDALSGLAPGAAAELSVDAARRRAISRHHSATHLIHWALRKVLGTHVRQAGTHKTPERLRFDFSHYEAVTPAQLREVERLVNEKVIDNAKVDTYETEFDRKPEGTLAFFGEKYGRIVRVVDIGGYSRELCGGTHVATTGEIGLVKIAAESAIAAGTRRIEAVAGRAAYDFVAAREEALAAVSLRLSAGPQDVSRKLEAVLARQAELERKLKAFEQRAAAGLADELAAGAALRDGLKFVSAVVSAESPEALRSLGAQVLAKLGEGVAILGSAFGGKATVVAFCSPAAVKSGRQAGRLVAELSAKLGGKGGGKPDFAMGGGRDVAKLEDVLRPA